LMAEGKTDRAIAVALDLKFSTVRNHAQHILDKLDVHSRREAVWRARHRGLV
jgi:DNA-binding NarL/FixJ family response regulator